MVTGNLVTILSKLIGKHKTGPIVSSLFDGNSMIFDYLKLLASKSLNQLGIWLTVNLVNLGGGQTGGGVSATIRIKIALSRTRLVATALAKSAESSS